MSGLVAGLGLVLIAATILPLVPSPARWVRVFDFPRLQIGVLLLVAIAAHLLAQPPGAPFGAALLAALVAAAAWQGFRIFPYTPLARPQARAASGRDPGSCLRLVIANVRMENRNAGGLLRLLADADPDVALLIETDAWWDEALTPLGANLPHAVRQPQDNYYGMVLYSRFPFGTSDVAFLVDPNLPSIHVTLRLPSGDAVAVHGVHPSPPPLADTRQRDAEILIVGEKAKASGLPAIVCGDLNDVGWSQTTRLFMRNSGLLDPRIGRGLFASYDARVPLLRWPLDHIFHDPTFTVRELRLLDAFGSDHFPVFADLCLEPGRTPADEVPEADEQDRSEARERIARGRAARPAADDYPQSR